MGYSLQGNRKTLEGSGHPDRDAQFEYSNSKAPTALNECQPVISVDTKKKELVGRYKNGGGEWMPQGSPEQVKVQDFVDKEPGRANPYGVYDVANNNAWVSVGRFLIAASGSGQWQQRVPGSLHARRAERAAREGVRLNTPVTAMIAEGIAKRDRSRDLYLWRPCRGHNEALSGPVTANRR
jgi:hypothetical protein